VVRRGALVLLLALTGCAVERPAPPPAIPALLPPPILSGFGDWHGAGGTPRPWQHHGIDIRVPVGTPVLAAADGTVSRVARGMNTGRMIVVLHADDFATTYLHLSQVGVRAGQIVRRGALLGRSGITGNATTPHLHFGVCRRPGGVCGARIDEGWDDPGRHWIDGNPCLAAGREYPASPLRLTYPVHCRPAAT